MNKPNIVFLLADDLGWKDLGCYGSDFYETPRLDALRSQGMLFTDAYAACPVCSPTRGSLLTGKYPATLGITDWIDWGGSVHPARGALIDVPYIRQLPLSEKTLAHTLAENGYETWHIGKWHLGGPGHYPEDVGFQRNIGGCHRGSPSGNGYFSPWSIEALADVDVPEGTYLTDYLTDRAVELIRDGGSPGDAGSPGGAKTPGDPTTPGGGRKPFFLNMWYYLVHTPIEAPEDLVEKYRAKARAMGLDEKEAFSEGDFYPCEHMKDKRIKRRLFQSDPVYAAMVEKLDESVGRILDVLAETGQAENTIVMFTSDNGGLSTAARSPTSNAPLAEGKGWMYDGGVREPLLVRWPGQVEVGSTCDVPVTSPDFYPTLLDCIGLRALPEQHVDGTSFAAALGLQSSEARDAGNARPPVALSRGRPDVDELRERSIFWHYPHYGNQGGTPGSSVRKGDWKLLHFFEDDAVELYHLREDISEEHDLANEDPERASAMKAELEQWRRSVGAKIPQENPEFEAWAERGAPHHSAQA